MRVFLSGDTFLRSSSDFLSDDLRNLISECDHAVCNFEAPIGGHQPIPKMGAHLKQDPKSIDTLRRLGFKNFGLGNNHIGDFGDAGVVQTVQFLKETDSQYSGVTIQGTDPAWQPILFKDSSVSVAILALGDREFYFNGSGVHFCGIDDPLIDSAVRRLKEKVDYLVLYVHAGLEVVPFPIPEWREKYRKLCELGANLIVCHHPHVIQGKEEYLNSRIYYSLGNFFFDYGQYGMRPDPGLSLIVTFDRKGLKVEEVFHSKKAGKLYLDTSPDLQNYYNWITSVTNSESYPELSRQQAMRVFDLRYRNLLGYGVTQQAKRLIKKLLTRRSSTQETSQMVWHNFGLMTHNSTIRLAAESYLTQGDNPGVEYAKIENEFQRVLLT